MVTPKKIIMKDLELADEEIARLRKENKELKNELMEDMKYEEKLEKENKKLKKYYDRDKEELMESCYALAKENKEQKEKIDTLELCIKNKDELLEEYRKKLDKLKLDNKIQENHIFFGIHS